jgi:1-deoxy-D-xylulose-5-phosphate reductoisomerase
MDRFPCLALAQQAGRAGGLAPTVLNAANEVAVAAFLEGRLNFCGIPAVIEDVLSAAPTGEAADLESILAADADARSRAAAGVSGR